jgi:hypothetical protein
VNGLALKGLNSLNRYVFYGWTPNLSLSLRLAGEERMRWEMAGAKGMSFLAAQHPEF